MKKLRLSYTLLSLWEKGRVDDAVRYYKKIPMEMTEAMIQGKEWDKKNSESIEKNKKFIKEFGDWKLQNPKAQLKLEISYNEMLDLVIVPDCVDGDILYEHKTGKRSATSYLSDKQLGVYALGLKLSDIPIRQAYLIRFNQHTNKTDWAKKIIGDWVFDDTDNYIQTLAPEIHKHFSDINIL